VIINGDENSIVNEEDINPYDAGQANTAITNGQPYTYIAGIVNTSDISEYPYPYLVGEGLMSSIGEVTYVNTRLQSNTMYAILVRAHTTDDLVSVLIVVLYLP